MPSRTTQCLIVYHPEDAARALEVKAALSGLRVGAWVEVDDMELGQLRLQQWAEAIRDHAHIFLFWSAAAAGEVRRIEQQYTLALEEHGAIVPVCLDGTPLPGVLKLYWAIQDAGGLSPAELAVIMEARVTGRRQMTGPRVTLADLAWPARPDGPIAILALRPGPGQAVTPQLLRETLAWAEGSPVPTLVVGPYGGAPGAFAGSLGLVIQDHCPAHTAVVLSFDQLPYDEIPDKLVVHPGGDSATVWPALAVWAGGQPPVYQVDLGLPLALARAGPRIPVFRTLGGLFLGALSMAPAPDDAPETSRTLAGLFTQSLSRLPDGPDLLHLGLLLTPDGAWERSALGPLREGLQGRPVPCQAIFSHCLGLHAEPYLEEGPCAYRTVIDLPSGRTAETQYRLLGPDGRLGQPEPATPLRQLLKRHMPAALPDLPYRPAIRQGLDDRYTTVRRALLDSLTEGRRREILRLLHFFDEHDGLDGAGLSLLARVLSKLALGGPVHLPVPDRRHTALWADRTLVSVVRGSNTALPSRIVADYCSRHSEQHEQGEFDLYGRSVILLEHFGDCPPQRYHSGGLNEAFEVSPDLQEALAPLDTGIRYCGFSQLQALLLPCENEAEARDRLREVG